jgi:hypothetical protein
MKTEMNARFIDVRKEKTNILLFRTGLKRLKGNSKGNNPRKDSTMQCAHGLLLFGSLGREGWPGDTSAP